MVLQQRTIAIVGADHANRRGPSRRFELAMCSLGEDIILQLEPSNPVDPNAVAALSTRGIQIGYIAAERAPWIAGMMRRGRLIKAIYQGDAPFGAWVRIAFDGQQPTLPPQSQRSRENEPADKDLNFSHDQSLDG